jgi:basic membrane lipoprotein Med (substrate-binding protein (PBP1-ABC) superfamily)
MGIFDKAKDLAGLKDQAEDLLEEHGDKLPDGVKEKVEAAKDKIEGLIPGKE